MAVNVLIIYALYVMFGELLSALMNFAFTGIIKCLQNVFSYLHITILSIHFVLRASN